MRKPTAVPAVTLAVVLAFAVSVRGGSSNGAAQPSAAAWCAMVIDINTRAGTMANKQYLESGLADPVKAKAAAQEAVKRRNELLAITPPEIKDAMTHELNYYVASLKNPSAGMGDFTIADVRALSSFQKTKCGIGGI